MKTYELEFDVGALKEWHKLDGSIRAQFKKQLAKRLLTPHVASAKLRGVTTMKCIWWHPRDGALDDRQRCAGIHHNQFTHGQPRRQLYLGGVLHGDGAGLPLLTANFKHFSAIGGLELVVFKP